MFILCFDVLYTIAVVSACRLKKASAIRKCQQFKGVKETSFFDSLIEKSIFNYRCTDSRCGLLLCTSLFLMLLLVCWCCRLHGPDDSDWVLDWIKYRFALIPSYFMISHLSMYLPPSYHELPETKQARQSYSPSFFPPTLLSWPP